MSLELPDQLVCTSEEEAIPAFTSFRAFPSQTLMKYGKGVTLMVRGTGSFLGTYTEYSSNFAFVGFNIPHCRIWGLCWVSEYHGPAALRHRLLRWPWKAKDPRKD